MLPEKKRIEGTPYSIAEERLSSVCRVFIGDIEKPVAQFYVQSSLLGQCVIKGLDSPNLPFKQRRQAHEAIWRYLANEMGYEYATLQRVKVKPKISIVTSKKLLKRYKS